MKKIKAAPGQLLRLDLGCGDNKREGFLGVDVVKTPTSDIVQDLRRFPWPMETGSVEELHCSHFLEHIPGPERMPFMDECWRILRPKGKMTVIVPHWNSMRSVQDPTHAWPPLAETSFLYFDRNWRQMNKLTHYPVKCNFSFTYGYVVDPEVGARNSEHQQFAIKHYANAAQDLFVTLTRED